MKASMSRKGNCWDNACSETLFGSLKVERLHGMEFKSHREAKDATLDWLLWYNGSRMHSTLRYLSPAQFEQQAIADQQRPEVDPGSQRRTAELILPPENVSHSELL
jgi:transposase InsO family protein